MNKITRRLAVAGVTGVTVLGGLSLTTAISSAQETPTTQAPRAQATAPAERPEGCEHGRHHGPNLDVAASTIGISVDDLHTALHDGSTLAALARAHGVDPQKVIDALVADAKQHVADEVSSGHLTQDQASQRLADVTSRITDVVNNGKPDHHDGPRPADRSDDGNAPS